MQESQNSNALHWILGAALLLIGLFVVIALVNVKSQAADVDTDVTITNTAPSVVNTFITEASSSTFVNDVDGIAPNAGATKTIWVTGYIADNNGENDITQGTGEVLVSLYRTGVACDNETDGSTDANDCYKNGTANSGITADAGGACTIDDTYGGADLQASFSCPITLSYWVDATVAGGVDPTGSWTAAVTVRDFANAEGLHSSTTNDINTLASLSVGTSIAYPQLGLGDSTTVANDVELVLTQQANDVATVSVQSATQMTCSIGSIPVANEEWSLESFTFGAGTDLTSAPVATSASVGYKTIADVTDSIFWGIQIPATGVGGACDGETLVTVSAA